MTSPRRLLVGVLLFVALNITGHPARMHAQRSPIRKATIAWASIGELRAWDTDIDRMLRLGDLAVRRVDQDRLVSGRVHERMDQYWSGVRVYGGDVVRQTADGVTVSLFGTIYPDIDIDVEPALTPRDAAATIEADSGVVLGGDSLPQLLILPEADRFRLTYHAYAYSTTGSFEYFVDANTGAIVEKRDAEQRQAAVGAGTGVLGDQKKLSVTQSGGSYRTDDQLRPPALRTYDMRENLTRTMAVLNGTATLTIADEGTDTDNAWNDPSVVDAHAYVGFVYDYFYRRFGRHGLDNNDLQIRSLVHTVRQADYATQSATVRGTYYTNASWNPGPRIMLFGEGAPASLTIGGFRYTYFAGGLDIVGHELTHGVTQFTSNLIYLNESGALNESFSDMMGTAVEFFYQPAGDGALRADYLCGEDVATPGGFRSMANPAAYGDPDHYSRRLITTADNGGVHTNSSIGNHAYYLAIEGGVNRTSGLAVTGVGLANREQIEKVMYRAFTQLMPSNATYAVARTATIQAARDLYGAGSAAERAIMQAWTAVGVN